MLNQDRARVFVWARFPCASRYPLRSKTLQSDGSIMRRAIAIAAAGLSLAGCSSFSLDAFKPAPPTVQVQLDSTPQGADALTSRRSGLQDALLGRSDGPGRRILRDLHLEQVPAGDRPGASSIHGDLHATVDPNPVVAELQPAGPPPKAGPEKVLKPKKPKPPRSRAGACRRLAVPQPSKPRRRAAARRRASRRPAGDRCTAPVARSRRLYAHGMMHRLGAADVPPVLMAAAAQADEQGRLK